MTLVWDNSFRRAFKRLVRKNPQLREKIFEVLEVLDADPFFPSLKSHKLRGNLDGLWACWVEYNCRIIFSLVTDEESGEELIVLIDIGSHDEVY
ncbi:type II toxin-antitoxin system mRNA interferase toxin, RelE/StbE family [Phormidium sp. LEGE 05292]|uniref:type II toxin-antitoxin system RelE/ParE family toxin n=1 Tax=[Phormidium] sp. LEGE 05292 TaxID=767427 RepID=UPI001881CCE2|nr:type II toxin-antitoxin system mRNA interferase toxin, RelE/StbE family [Phormidium sp. LEGE 05292]MBE9227720.1 type II toxin-antitoxin system mRNA interferase toxin, RelE/StbE family [Phormidium sp. LEGE 05292]